MAWSWSHTNEAYEAVRQNISEQERHWLEVVYSEWCAYQDAESPNDFNEEIYEQSRSEAKKLPDDVLADFIWEKTQELATCTNGGHKAYCCPFGCICHQLPFDHVDQCPGA